MVACLTVRSEKRKNLDEALKVVPTKTKQYYANASRKARERRKKETKYLTLRNSFIESERPILAGRMQSLSLVVGLKVAQYQQGIKSKNKKIYLAENEALKEEVRCYRKLSDKLKSFLEGYHQMDRLSSYSLVLRKNVSFMVEGITDYAFFSAQQPNLTMTPQLLSDILFHYENLITRIPNKASLRKLDVSNINFDVRISDGLDNSRWQRLDVYDIPIPKSKFMKSLSLAREDWGNLVLNAYLKKTPVSRNGLTKVPLDVQDITSSKFRRTMGEFQTQVRRITSSSTDLTSLETTYHDVLEPLFFTSSEIHPQKCEIMVSTLLPSALMQMIELDKEDTNVAQGFIVREGSSSNTSHATIFFRSYKSQVEYEEMLENPPPNALPKDLHKAEHMSRLEKSEIVKLIMQQSDNNVFGSILALIYLTASRNSPNSSEDASFDYVASYNF